LLKAAAMNPIRSFQTNHRQATAQYPFHWPGISSIQLWQMTPFWAIWKQIWNRLGYPQYGKVVSTAPTRSPKSIELLTDPGPQWLHIKSVRSPWPALLSKALLAPALAHRPATPTDAVTLNLHWLRTRFWAGLKFWPSSLLHRQPSWANLDGGLLGHLSL
jgi:hypothetical protein